MADTFSFEADTLATLRMLNDLPKQVNREVNGVTKVTAFKVMATADKSISSDPSQGKTYTRGGVKHTASKAGDAPNSDTGVLAGSIKVLPQQALGGLDSFLVGSPLDYAAWMEYGTLTTAARPWLQPAVDKVETDHIKRMTIAVKKAIKNAEQ